MSEEGVGSDTYDVSADNMTKWTASDAFASKFSAFNVGYLPDRFGDPEAMYAMKSALERLNGKKFMKRSPIMHRGYLSRMEGQHLALEKAIESLSKLETSTQHPAVQLVFFGCGYDLFPLHAWKTSVKKLGSASLIEVDYHEVTQNKARLYSTSPPFQNLFGSQEKMTSDLAPSDLPLATVNECEESDKEDEVNPNKTFSPLKGPVFHTKSDGIYQFSDAGSGGGVTVIGQDMRDLKSLREKLLNTGWCPTAPTLVFTECVLVYLPEETSRGLIKMVDELLEKETSAFWITYDMIMPFDTYGRMMRHNLQRAGFLLPGFTAFPSAVAQRRRFLCPHIAAEPFKVDEKETDGRFSAHFDIRPPTTEELKFESENACGGWRQADTISMLTFYNDILPESWHEHVGATELFDEIEEWNMIMSHYALTVASRQTAFDDVLRFLTTPRQHPPPPPISDLYMGRSPPSIRGRTFKKTPTKQPTSDSAHVNNLN